jgi:hypothetical protein
MRMHWLQLARLRYSPQHSAITLIDVPYEFFRAGQKP